MKLTIIFICLVCFVCVTFPLLSGTDIGEKIIGQDGIFIGTFETISNVSTFFSETVQKIIGTINDIKITITTGWENFTIWLSGLFN